MDPRQILDSFQIYTSLLLTEADFSGNRFYCILCILYQNYKFYYKILFNLKMAPTPNFADPFITQVVFRRFLFWSLLLQYNAGNLSEANHYFSPIKTASPSHIHIEVATILRPETETWKRMMIMEPLKTLLCHNTIPYSLKYSTTFFTMRQKIWVILVRFMPIYVQGASRELNPPIVVRGVQYSWRTL